jgi:hypothetical protein
MLAIEEWLTTDYGRGPLTQLTVFDFVTRKQCALAKVDNGFVAPTEFSGRTVLFQERYFATHSVIDRRVELPLPGEWTWIDAPLNSRGKGA